MFLFKAKSKLDHKAMLHFGIILFLWLGLTCMLYSQEDAASIDTSIIPYIQNTQTIDEAVFYHFISYCTNNLPFGIDISTVREHLNAYTFIPQEMMEATRDARQNLMEEEEPRATVNGNIPPLEYLDGAEQEIRIYLQSELEEEVAAVRDNDLHQYQILLTDLSKHYTNPQLAEIERQLHDSIVQNIHLSMFSQNSDGLTYLTLFYNEPERVSYLMERDILDGVELPLYYYKNKVQPLRYIRFIFNADPKLYGALTAIEYFDKQPRLTLDHIELLNNQWGGDPLLIIFSDNYAQNQEEDLTRFTNNVVIAPYSNHYAVWYNEDNETLIYSEGENGANGVKNKIIKMEFFTYRLFFQYKNWIIENSGLTVGDLETEMMNYNIPSYDLLISGEEGVEEKILLFKFHEIAVDHILDALMNNQRVSEEWANDIPTDLVDYVLSLNPQDFDYTTP